LFHPAAEKLLGIPVILARRPVTGNIRVEQESQLRRRFEFGAQVVRRCGHKKKPAGEPLESPACAHTIIDLLHYFFPRAVRSSVAMSDQ
jgi:hypothetical protein